MNHALEEQEQKADTCRTSEVTLRQPSDEDLQVYTFYDTPFNKENRAGIEQTPARGRQLARSTRTKKQAPSAIARLEMKRLKSFHSPYNIYEDVFLNDMVSDALRALHSNIVHSFSAPPPLAPIASINIMIPEELMLDIFLQLYNRPDTLACAAQVCKRWGTILRDNGLWKGLCRVKNFHPIRPLEATSLATPVGKLRCRCESASKKCATGDAFFRGTKKCNVIWGGVSLSPWKSVYKQNFLTFMNWMRGRYTMQPLLGNMNSLCLAFDENWAVLIAPGEPGKLMDVRKGNVHLTLEGHQGIVSAVKLRGKHLITGGVDSTLRVWDIGARECIRVLEGHQGEVVSVQFNHQIIASGSEDTTIRVWGTKKVGLLQVLSGHTGAVCSLQIYADSIVSGSIDHSIRIWNWKRGSCDAVLKGHTGYVYCLEVHSDLICSGSSDGLIKIWDMKTRCCIKTLEGHDSGVVCLQFDGVKIVSGSGDYTVKVWNWHLDECLYTLRHHTATVWSLNCVGTKLMTSSFDTSLVMLDFAEAIPDEEDCP